MFAWTRKHLGKLLAATVVLGIVLMILGSSQNAGLRSYPNTRSAQPTASSGSVGGLQAVTGFITAITAVLSGMGVFDWIKGKLNGKSSAPASTGSGSTRQAPKRFHETLNPIRVGTPMIEVSVYIDERYPSQGRRIATCIPDE